MRQQKGTYLFEVRPFLLGNGECPHFLGFQTRPAWIPSKVRTRERRLADGAAIRMVKPDTVVGLDVALIERARKGDSRAFERLYRDHVGRVHGLCLRMTRNPDLAADCVQ